MVVSVIIPCFNAERFLAPTLASLQAQELAGWECVIVDDGSTDATFEIASRFAAIDARFSVIRQANAGRALALRAGCEHVSSEPRYLFFLDSDDILESNALSRMSRHLDSNPQASIAACQSRLIDEFGNSIEGLVRSRWVPGRILPKQLRAEEMRTPFVTFFCGTGQGPFAMHRRSVFERTTGLDPRFSEFSLHEDTDIFCQMALLGEVHYLPEVLYQTRRHGANVSRGNPQVQLAYAKFREKWDSYAGATAEQQRVIEQARKFYRRTFRPCRNVKVGFRALKEFLTSPDTGRLRWAAHLMGHAVRDFVRFRLCVRK